MCRNTHGGVCNKAKAVAVAKLASSSAVSSSSSASSTSSTASKKSCRVCKLHAHTYKRKDGSTGLANKVSMCPKFRNASDKEKQDIIKTVEAEHKHCIICFYIGHNMAKCNHAVHCSQNYSSDACEFQAFFSCSVRAASIGGGMSLQDIPIDSNGEVASLISQWQPNDTCKEQLLL